MQNLNTKVWTLQLITQTGWFFEVFVFVEAHIFANYIVLLPSTLQKYIINPALLKIHLEKIRENLGTGGRVNIYGA